MAEAAAATETPAPNRPLPPTDRTSALKQLAEEDDRSLKEWIDSLAGEGAVKVQIIRKKPMVGPNGENVAGSLETVEDRIDEDYLREMWGGGTFQLKIFRQNGQGVWNYVRARTLPIAGAPKMAGQLLTLGGAAPATPIASANDDLAERAMNTMERQTERAQQRMEQLEKEVRRGSGLDIGALDALLKPIRDQLAAAQQDAREARAQLAALVNKPAPTDPFRDRVMEKMIDGESARLDALRQQYENRIERLRDSHDDAIKRLEDRHRADIERLERAHERALAQTEKSSEATSGATKLGYETRIDALKGEISKLERELQAAQTRIATLEARKDQTLTEKAEELVKVRDALDGIGGGGDDKERSTWEKVIDTVGNLPAVETLVNKIGGGGGGAQQQQPQLPPPGIPFQTPDGQVWMIGPDGQPRPINQQQLAARQAQLQQQLAVARKKRKAQRAAAPPAAPPQVGAGDTADQALADGAGDAAPEAVADAGLRAPDPGEVKLALTFMENAMSNGTDPVAFANTARHMVPADIVRFIQRVGVDEFLNKAVEPGSNMSTQRGRNFARAVFKALLEG